MQRLVAVWLVLQFSYLFAWTILSGIGYQSWDLRYEEWIKIVLLPFIQALAVCAIIFGLRLPAIGTLLRSLIRRQPLIGLLLAIDALILLGGWILPQSRWADLAAAGSIPNNYTGLKAFAAALMVGRLALKRSWMPGQRLWLLVFACGVALFGLDYFLGWSADVPQVLLTGIPMLLVRWVILYGCMFIVSILVLLKMEAIWRGYSEAAGMLINAAVTFALLNAIVVACNVFNRPYLLPPWSTLARSLGFLMMSSIWFAVFDVRRSPQLWSSESLAVQGPAKS